MSPLLSDEDRAPRFAVHGRATHCTGRQAARGIPRLPLAVASLVALCVLSGCAERGGYPNRPITLICPWAAGGGTDTVSRQVAALLERELDVPVADAYAESESAPEPPDDGFFDHIYAQPPARLAEQRAAFNATRGSGE